MRITNGYVASTNTLYQKNNKNKKSGINCRQGNTNNYW